MKIYSIYFVVSMAFWGCAKTYQVYSLPGSSAQSEKARMFILRPAFAGTAVRTEIYQNNSFVGYLGPRSYLCWDVTPGEILITSIAAKKEYFSVLAKPGKTYYFKQLLKTRLFSPGSKLKPITEKEAKGILQKVKKPDVKVI